jgi:YVTN family beta-propeller protein
MRSGRHCLPLALILALAAGRLAGQGSPRTPDYQLKLAIPIGGEGGWDYVAFDTASGRAFAAHSTRVDVVDVAGGSLVGQIANTPGVHGIAIADELGRGFTSNGRENSVTIFDLRTLQELGRVKLGGQGPDAIVYEPVTRRVLTMNGGSGDASVIDAATGTVAGTIPLGGKPEFAVADGRGLVFANLEDRNQLVTIDVGKLKVLKTASLAPCESPTGLAMDRRNRRLFSVCRNRLMAIMDADAGRLLATVPIGERVDGAGFDPGTGLAFASNGDGTLTVVGPQGKDGYAVVQTVATRFGARTMALDPKTHNVLLVTADFGPPPEPTEREPRPRPTVVPESFVLLVYGMGPE